MATAADTAQLTANMEQPLVGEAPEGWCENYALVAHDPGIGVHLIYCTGSHPTDLALWHEYLLIALPGGQTLAWRSAGRGGDERGPGGALSRWCCLTPGATWRLSFSGFGRRVATESLDEAGLSDGPWTPAEIELEFDAMGPPWQLSGHDLRKAGETSPFHYEQAGRVTGKVSVGSDSFTFGGSGHRDHSRGPREYASVLDHAWIDGQLPDGRFFAAYRMRLADGSEGVAAACVGDSKSLSPATAIQIPLLDEEPGDQYELMLEANGQRHTIRATIVTPIGTTSYMTPNGMAAGRLDGPEVTQIVSDGATRFTWGEDVGWGHTQRSVAPAHRGGGGA
jgi:hypothetical protein